MLQLDETNTILFTPSKCMQCGVCLSVCPKGALNYKRGKHCYAIVIDHDRCIGCGLCAKVCPSNYIFNDRVDFDRVTDKNVFLTYAKDENVQFTSSSGGTVRTIAKEFVQHDNSVIYSLYEQDNELKCGVIDGSLVDSMPNSIYAPTMWGRGLQQVKRLSAGSRLLVIGLPCQIKAAKKVIDKCSKQIEAYYIAIICRKTKDFRFERYIRDYHHIKGDDKRITFRGYGWPGVIGDYYDSQFSQFSQFSLIPFGLDLWNIKGCYRCADCLAQDVADLSIGDPWTLDCVNDKGCNITFINSSKGRVLLEQSRGSLYISSLSKEQGESVLGRNMVSNKINRVRFYSKIDKRFSQRLKYFLLDSKSNMFGMLISRIGKYPYVDALGGVLIKIDRFIKKIFS